MRFARLFFMSHKNASFSVKPTLGSLEIILIPLQPCHLIHQPIVKFQTKNMKQNKRGRKPKAEWQLLRNQIKLNLDDGNYAVIRDKVRESGLSMNQFCTRAIMGTQVRRALTDEEYSMVRDLQGIANNLNQLTKLAHGIGFKKVVAKIEPLLDETLRLLSKFRM